MTAVLDRLPVEQITADAKTVDAGRVLLSLLAAIPFVLGWTAGKIVLVVAWVCLAIKAGWLDARRPRASGEGG